VLLVTLALSISQNGISSITLSKQLANHFNMDIINASICFSFSFRGCFHLIDTFTEERLLNAISKFSSRLRLSARWRTRMTRCWRFRCRRRWSRLSSLTKSGGWRTWILPILWVVTFLVNWLYLKHYNLENDPIKNKLLWIKINLVYYWRYKSKTHKHYN
jgi:hypothetical protein